jgi:diguanylate cyclase (GGDEF)-like protein/PAS domain S-box-containing protein
VEKELRILLLEDLLADAELVERELRRAGLRFELRWVERREEFERALAEFAPDLVLSDFSMPGGFDGLAALELTRAHGLEIPFVFVSGTIGEDRAVEAMRHGATDYVLKERLNRLVPVVRRALAEAEERAARRAAERELEQARSRLESIVSSVPDVVWSVALAPPRVLYLSRSAQALWGREDERAFADPEAWFELVHPHDREAVRAAWREALGGASLDLVYRALGPDGSVRWIHNRARAVRDETGAPVRLDGVARDITEQKLQELRIARLNRALAVMSGINAAIVRVRNRAELYREACRVAVEEGGFRLAWIGVPVGGEAKVEPAAWHGAGERYLEEVGRKIREVGLDEGLAGRALRSRCALVVHDVEHDPRVLYRTEALAHGYRSIIVLPVLVSGSPACVFAIHAAEPDAFGAEEVRLFEEVAGDVGFALDHLEKVEKLDYLAFYDALTGLPNRSLCLERLDSEIRVARRENRLLALALLDLERFRAVNSAFGRDAGDAVLVELGRRLRAALGERSTLARLPPDRYAAAFYGARDAASAARAIESALAHCLSAPFRLGERELRIAAKCGVALFPGDAEEAEALLHRAELALGRAKEAGERIVFYASEMNARVAETFRLENELRAAVAERRFVLHYQPRVELASGRVTGLEALLRWQHPARGLVSPGEFIPVLEATGLIYEAGRWALERAALDCAAWRAKGHALRVSINVSQLQLRRAEFVEEVKAAFAQAGAAPHGMGVEITETMLMEEFEASIGKLRALRDLGVEIALDDFGTGYSSLACLGRLPLHAVKIDRSFVAEMTRSPEATAIVSTIISLARSLDFKVVAEGVEEEEQRRLLRLLRCDEIQGYLVSRPLPAEALEGLLAKQALPQ